MLTGVLDQEMDRICWKCQNTYPLTAEYFGHMPNRNFRWVCKPCQAKTTKIWKTNNPVKARTQSRKRNRQLQNAEGRHDEDDITLICEELDDCCYYCGEYVGSNFHKDHMVPISRGGTHWPSNMTIACETCNLDKHNKTVNEFLEWRQERGMPIAEWLD
jgi:5-methylcytosine-specific restriction endonuclease McrA